MARGWESKSIEAQQDEVMRTRDAAAAPRAPDPHAAERRTLELARAQAASQLTRAQLPHHRSMLDAAIRDLEQRLTRLAAND